MILDYREYVMENGSNGIVNYINNETNIALFNHISVCPYCKTKIDNIVYSNLKRDYPEWLFGPFDQFEKVVQCPICGWWEYKYSNHSDAILDGKV